MNPLISMIVNQIIKALEEELVANAPELRKAFIKEVGYCINSLTGWVNDKLDLLSTENEDEEGYEETYEGNETEENGQKD